MTGLRTAAQQALEALEQDNPAGRGATITTLRAALEKTEPRRAAVACKHRNEPRGCYRVRCQLGRKCVEA